MMGFSEMIPYLILGLFGSAAYLITAELRFKQRNEQISWFRRMMILLLGVYLTVVFAITVSPVYGFLEIPFASKISLTPFHVFKTAAYAPINFYGNILLFVPLGFLLVMLSKKCRKIYITFFAGAAMSSLIEFIQLFEDRMTDIDDIILNSMGTLIGYVLAMVFLFCFPALKRKIGIMRNETNKFQKNDAGCILILSFVILTCVFVGGFKQLGEIPTLQPDYVVEALERHMA